MSMKDKKKYIAPELTVVTFKVERGYAQSALKTIQLILPAAFNNVSPTSTQEGWGAIDQTTFGDTWQ